MSERELLFAVIQKAIEDYKINPQIYKDKSTQIRARLIKRRAENWLRSEKDKFMSFEWYCGLSNIDSDGVRRAIGIN